MVHKIGAPQFAVQLRRTKIGMSKLAFQLWRTKFMRLSWQSNYGAQNWCATVDRSAMSHKIGGPQLSCPTMLHKIGAPQFVVQLWRTKSVCLSWMSNY